MNTTDRTCVKCNSVFYVEPKRGRPPTYCQTCKPKSALANDIRRVFAEKIAPAPRNLELREMVIAKREQVRNRIVQGLYDGNSQTALRKLVSQHVAWTKKSTALHHMYSDRKDHKTGELMKCDLPLEVRHEMESIRDSLKRATIRLQRDMERELKNYPIYEWLKSVFGLGVIASAYIVGFVDINKADKPSKLIRYCGMAVIDGKLERPTRGVALKYNRNMRTMMYQIFSSMWKNAAKKSVDAPFGCTTKYLEIWKNVKHRGISVQNMSKGAAHSKGWHKAAALFLEDLYTVWRAMEGLEIWPSYYAAMRGYEHGGKICVNVPQSITLEDAVKMVGNVGKIPLLAPDNLTVDLPDDTESDFEDVITEELILSDNAAE